MDSPLFWIVFEPVVSLLENILLVSFVYGCCGPQYPHSYRNIVSFLGIVLVGFGFSFFENMDLLSNYEFLITILFLLVYAYFFLSASIQKKATICIIARVLTTISNSLVVFLFSVFLHEDASTFVRQQDVIRVIIVLLTKIVYFFLGRLLISFFQHKSNFQKWQWISIGAGLLMSTFSGTMAISLIHTFSFDSQSFRLQMLTIVATIWVVCLLLYYLLNRMSKDNDTRMNVALLRQNDANQLSQIQQIQDSNERISNIKHDLKNYLATVKQLIESGDYSEAIRKCEAVTGLVDQVQVQIDTGNSSIDAILNDKISVSKHRKIDTKCSIFCNTTKLPEMAFCSVFGNLMDNAIEAEEELPEDARRIIVELYNRHGFIYLRIANVISGSVLATNPNMVSTKGDKDRHGYGHKSVERTMQELGGRIRYQEKDGLFIAECVFPY